MFRSLVATKEGPKVWDFRNSRDLEKHLLSNDVYELLARSDLIANQMICKCGLPMFFQSAPRRYQNEVRTGGERTNLFASWPNVGRASGRRTA